MYRYMATVVIECEVHIEHRVALASDNDDLSWTAAYQFANYLQRQGRRVEVDTWTIPDNAPPAKNSCDGDDDWPL